ncbi:MAG: hypothetical protein COY40_06335 [Alphaproteobacteria bacterium CG_4_10_14_0_8_um_filter_53_9]|nr:MAG: hypothetical protein COY40_06335 [Alphaproteobacteria bacterium CG_4_10_14_0_8_um_filter_53_9]
MNIRNLAGLTALAVLVAMPAFAMKNGGGERAPQMTLEQAKAQHAERHDKMMEKRDAQRAKMDAHMADCYAKVQGASSTDAMRAEQKKCREEGKAMHEKNMEKRKEWKADKKEKWGEMKEKREDAKIKWQERKSAE